MTGYHRDPITGHGITDAFRDADLLAEALDAPLAEPAREHEALPAFERGRNDALAATFRLTRELPGSPTPSRFVELQIELTEPSTVRPERSPHARHLPGSTQS